MAILDTILQQLNIWDGQLLLFIQNHLRSETLDPIVIVITNLGNAGIFWIVLSVILLFPKKTRRAGILSLLALLGSLCVTNFLLKNYVARVVIYKSCHRGIGVPALIFAFAISLSRLYVGVHYPSDVIAGMIIGTLIALILFWIFGEKKYKARARRHR